MRYRFRFFARDGDVSPTRKRGIRYSSLARRANCQTCRRGSSSVELAIVLPFVLFIFAVAVDYGRVFYKAQALDVATYNAAWYASGYAYAPGTSSSSGSQGTGPTNSLTNTQASNTQAFTVTPSAPAGNQSGNQGQNVIVTANTTFTLLTPILSDNRSINLTRTWTVPLKPPLATPPVLPAPTPQWSPRQGREDGDD